MGLNEAYSSLQTQILLMNLIPDINKVFSLVIQEERQKSAGKLPSTESMALSVATENSKKNSNDQRSKRGNNQRSPPIFSHCGTRGHVVDKCYKLHGYPPGYKFTNPNSSQNLKPVAEADKQPDNSGKPTQSAFFASLNADQYAQLMSMLQSHLGTSTSPTTPKSEVNHIASTCLSTSSTDTKFLQVWVIDSGASTHICCNQSLFVNLLPAMNTSVTLPDQKKFSVGYVGDVYIDDDLLLRNVLYIPAFSYNLLSVSALLKDSRFSINFSNTGCCLQDKLRMRTIGSVSCVDGLYLLHPPDRIAQFSAVVCSVSANLWHKRLGHPSFARLKLLQSALQFSNNDSHVCHVCPLAKQRKLSFPALSHVAENVFDIVHYDIWGPFRAKT